MNFKPGQKTMTIHGIGENTIIVATAEGKRFLFMYSRTLWEGNIEYEPVRVSYSDNLQDLLSMKEKEQSEYELIK